MGIKSQLKEYFRGVLAPMTGIPEAEFVFDLKEKIGDKVPPYAVILAGKAETENLWERDMQAPPAAAGQGHRELYTKYVKVIPFQITLGAEAEATVSNWEDQFARALPRTLWVGGWPTGILVTMTYGDTQYTDSASDIRDVNAFSVMILCEYKIYLTKEELKAVEPQTWE